MNKPTPLVIANWKMKLGQRASIDLAKAIRAAARPGVEVAVCPSFTSLAAVGDALAGSPIALGAQDVFWEPTGAFTGEVAPTQLKELGCQYVLVGHSERRQHLGETDAQVHKKIQASLAAGLTPVVCVGETYEERAQGNQDHVVLRQLTAAFNGVALADDQQLVVAYEPVWVIGTGQPIAPQHVHHAQQVIYHTLRDILPASVVDGRVRIIYGGSVDSDNVTAFTLLPGIAGVLPGASSLNADSFIALVQRVASGA